MSISAISGASSPGTGIKLNSSPGSFNELTVTAKIASELLSSMSSGSSNKEAGPPEKSKMEELADTTELIRAMEMSRRSPGDGTQEGPVYSNVNASTSRDLTTQGHSPNSYNALIDLYT